MLKTIIDLGIKYITYTNTAMNEFRNFFAKTTEEKKFIEQT